MSQMCVRTAGPEDLATLQAIGRESYLEHFGALWATSEARDAFLARDFSFDALRASLRASDDHLWLLATDSEGQCAGFAKVNWRRREPVTGICGAELQKIYFRSSATGRGYGAAVLERVLLAAVDRSAGAVWLDVLASNVGGRRFYLRAGFEIRGTLTFRTDHEELDMVVMVRTLDPVDGASRD